MAIYLTRQLGGGSLNQIVIAFRLSNYSSVGSAIKRTKQEICRVILSDRVVLVIGRKENITGNGVQKIPDMERRVGQSFASRRRGSSHG